MFLVIRFAQILRSDATEFSYKREHEPFPRMEPSKGDVERFPFRTKATHVESGYRCSEFMKRFGRWTKKAATTRSAAMPNRGLRSTEPAAPFIRFGSLLRSERAN
jgi:hypothetical protein